MKFIKNAKNYYVTKDGMVHSIDKNGIDKNGKKTFHRGRILKQCIKRGYPTVTIVYDDGKKRTKSVHRLILETFCPTEDNSLQVDHINGIKTDNRLENLEWVTSKENTRRAYSLGLAKVKDQDGEKNHMSKLKTEDVKNIICNLLHTHSDTEIGKMYSVARRTINDIRNKRTWKKLHSLLEGQSTIEIDKDAKGSILK